MKQPQQRACREGVALVMALVVMASLAVLLTVVTKQIVSQRRMADQRERRLLAEWLARAGVELAAARLLESPAGFVDEKRDLVSDSKIHIVVEKASSDVYAIAVAAELGPKEETPVTSSRRGRFHRTVEDGVVRLHALPPEASKTK